MKKLLEDRRTSYAMAAVLIAVLFYGVYFLFLRGGMGAVEDATSGRVYIDDATGKTFTHDIKAGETLPVEAPSGGRTGYPAEACYWTADGSVKSEPTWVVLNAMKGSKGRTFCPDCGREVVSHNPPAVEGHKAPPTEKDIKQSSKKYQADGSAER